MMRRADGIFRPICFVPFLSTWLNIPGRIRMSMVVALVGVALLVVFTTLAVRGDNSAPSQPPLPPMSAIANTSPAPKTLPGLSSAMLYELVRDLEGPSISQQRETFNINFTSSWHAFAEFTNQITQSNLAPQSYRMLWHPSPINSPTSPQLTMELQLAPGRYRGNQNQAITLPDRLPPEADHATEGAACQVTTLPAFTLQAAWPSRGYIQIRMNERNIRLSIDEFLENSWQLLRISSESVEFRRYGTSPLCPQAESITVAI